MIVIRNVQNRYIITLISLIFISIIGSLDYITGSEISFSIFYLVPILLVALYKNTEKTLITLNALFAALLWYLAEYYSRKYSGNFILVWNSFVRFVIFILVGLLTLNLKDKNKKLTQANKELLNLNTEKNKFIGIAAHDLRNPIGTIFSYSDLLLSEYKNKMEAQSYELLGYIKELSQNTLELLKNLLDISKIESGVIELSQKSQDYIEFIKKHIYLNQILANNKGINIVLETKEKEIISKFDEQYLSEVINNLLTNAIKYSFQKSKILIRLSVTEDNNVKTEVIDEGKGIRIEEQKDLFKYFQKTSTEPTAGEQSTGLGLAIAKKIIIEHKGRIGVKSEIDKGSNFYFELPK